MAAAAATRPRTIGAREAVDVVGAAAAVEAEADAAAAVGVVVDVAEAPSPVPQAQPNGVAVLTLRTATRVRGSMQTLLSCCFVCGVGFIVVVTNPVAAVGGRRTQR